MTSESDTGVRYWRGLGLWNVYFIAKLILFWAGYLNFHAYYNLVFASILLLPLPPLWLHRLRHVLAIPVGIGLLYYDSWFPPISRLLERPEVLQFSAPYLLELVNRFINWNMVDRKSTRLNSSHVKISYAVFCLKKKKKNRLETVITR